MSHIQGVLVIRVQIDTGVILRGKINQKYTIKFNTMNLNNYKHQNFILYVITIEKCGIKFFCLRYSFTVNQEFQISFFSKAKHRMKSFNLFFLRDRHLVDCIMITKHYVYIRHASYIYIHTYTYTHK